MDIEQVISEVSELLPNNVIRCWLDETSWISSRKLYERVLVPRWFRLFVLIARNGGWNVYDWGHTSTGGPFGHGLNQDEAIELIENTFFIYGVTHGSKDEQMMEAITKAYRHFMRMHKSIDQGAD